VDLSHVLQQSLELHSQQVKKTLAISKPFKGAVGMMVSECVTTGRL